MATGNDRILSEKCVKFLDDVHKLIIEEALDQRLKRSSKVTHYLPPHELEEELELDISAEGSDDDVLLASCRKFIKYSVPVAHPRNFSLLVAGHNSKSLAACWLTDALNPNVHTYEASPAAIIVQKYIIEELCKLVGYQSGRDGIFVPGSSFGNMMAIHLARYRYCGDVNKTGLFGLPRFIIFCSTHAHYSVRKAAQFLGFGTNSIRYIGTVDGRMKPDLLEAEINNSKQRGEVPLIVIATSGTTVLGSFDDLGSISDICKRHNIWCHADAAWGGGVLFSKRREDLLKGIERTDSVVWSLHKLTGAHLQCAVLLTPHQGLLQACNSAEATYLFSKDKCYDTSYDVGDKTVQCGLKLDSFKLWVMWKSMGHQGMTQQVERAFENSRYLTEKLKERPGFRLTNPSFQFVNICFWYIPKRLRGQEETQEWWNELGKVAPRMKQVMMEKGSTLISNQPLESDGLVNFFRIIVSNSCSQLNDLDFVLDELECIGRDL